MDDDSLHFHNYELTYFSEQYADGENIYKMENLNNGNGESMELFRNGEIDSVHVKCEFNSSQIDELNLSGSNECCAKYPDMTSDNTEDRNCGGESGTTDSKKEDTIDTTEYNTGGLSVTQSHTNDVCCRNSADEILLNFDGSMYFGKSSIMSNMKEQKSDINNSPKSNIMTITSEKRFKCEICDYESNHRRYLTKHMLTHTKHKRYKCEMCDYRANYRHNLKRHMLTHTRHKPYKCDMCSYSSSEQRGLKNHMLTHTGDRPYICNLCDFRGKQLIHLKNHMMTHTQQKPYKCDVCNYTFARVGQLKRHKYKHTGDRPYKCDVCSFSCTTPGRLVTHNMKHTGEKPYTCDVCSRGFTKPETVQVHKMTHSSVKPYKCDLCDYSSNQKGKRQDTSTDTHRRETL